MLLDWLIPTIMRLESFFNYYNGNPYQRAAIQQLQEGMPPELLSHEAEWFETWKAGGKVVPFGVVYFHQLDLEGGEVKCFTSAMAMLAKYYGIVNTQKEYDDVRRDFGDTREALTHIKALERLGVRPEFVMDANVDLIEAEIDAGRPVGVGWLHRGDFNRGERPRGGHWAVIIGYTEKFFIVHDPMGEHDLVRGVLKDENGGNAVRYLKEEFVKRWSVEGEKHGWAMLVDPLPPEFKINRLEIDKY